METDGYLSTNPSGVDRRSAETCNSGCFLTMFSSTLPPMKPVAPVLGAADLISTRIGQPGQREYETYMKSFLAAMIRG